MVDYDKNWKEVWTEPLLASLGVVAKERKEKNNESSNWLTNRTALFQTHLLCMTMYGLSEFYQKMAMVSIIIAMIPSKASNFKRIFS